MAGFYRIFFHNAAGRIVGREDFEAPDDGAAIGIANGLFEACADISERFELWQGARLVAVPRSISLRVEKIRLNVQLQAHVRDVEIRLRDSHWAVAKSRRLLDRIEKGSIFSDQPSVPPTRKGGRDSERGETGA